MRVDFEESYTEYEEIDDLSVLEDSDISEAAMQPVQGAFPQPLYQLKLEYSKETFYAAHIGLDVQAGDYVIAPTRYGEDMAVVMGAVRNPIGASVKDVVTITRKADNSDFARARENKEKEKTAALLFKEKVAAHQLEM